MGIGIDALPEKIRNSHILTGNDLGQLGNLERLPGKEEILALMENPEIKELIGNSSDISTELNRLALNYLQTGHAYEALKLLMFINL